MSSALDVSPVLPTGQPPVAPTLEFLVAMSFLRLGTDTLVPRLLSEIIRPRADAETAPDAVACYHRLADELGWSRGVRGSRLAEARRRAAAALEAASIAGVTPLTLVDPRYPAMLRAIPDPPIVLWIIGDVATLAVSSVAIVGARAATPGGLATARRLGRHLAEAGLTVVSGLARGIDAAAHTGALDGGGRTIAVFGCGPDVIYPAAHHELAGRVRQNGVVVSEFPPGTWPLPRHFPLRNRIISGLAKAVVVVEAAERSGSLITARAALEQGRDVLAVPGNVASGCYRGSHALIKDGARLVETVEDILEEIGWARAKTPAESPDSNSNNLNYLRDIVRLGEALSADEVAARCGRSAAVVLADLGALEVAGQVVRLAGGTFVRLD